MKKVYAVLPIPLFLSGCMMLGMGGMGHAGGGGKHGGSQGSSMSGQTLVKESEVNGIRITAEFPPYVLGDQLAYKVTLRDVRDKSLISEASIALIVTRDDSRDQGSGSAQAGSHSGHGDSSTSQRLDPVEIDHGTYVFHPSITNGGVYKFVFILNRTGNVMIDPPIEVEQSVRFDRPGDQHSGNGGHGTRSHLAPAVLLGAGVMAIMMLLMFR